MNRPVCKNCKYYVWKTNLLYMSDGYYCKYAFKPYAHKWGNCIDDCEHNDKIIRERNSTYTWPLQKMQ